MKKYELTTETKLLLGKTLYRIRALVAFGNVRVGELGGWIEKEANLGQSGDAWVSGNAWVYGDARVYGNAQVSGDARVSGDAWVYGNAQVSGDARVSGDAWVYGNAQVYGNAWVYGDAWVSGNAWVYGDARVYGNAQVSGDARVSGDAWVYGDARVYGNAQVSGDAWVYGDAEILKNTHYLCIGSIGSRNGFTTFFRTKDKQIFVCCGCFEGDINKFVEAVKKTHSGTKHEKTYLMAVELAKAQIEDTKDDAA